MKKPSGLTALAELLEKNHGVLGVEDLNTAARGFLGTEVCPRLGIAVDWIDLVTRLPRLSSYYSPELADRYPQQIKLVGDYADGSEFNIVIAHGDTGWKFGVAYSRPRGSVEYALPVRSNYRFAPKYKGY